MPEIVVPSQPRNRACIVCGRPSLRRGSRCREHASGWDRKPKARDLIYLDPAYKRARATILASNPGCSYPGCPKVADTIHHVRSVARGGTNDPSNLAPMCRKHNELLGIREGHETKRRRRGKRRGL